MACSASRGYLERPAADGCIRARPSSGRPPSLPHFLGFVLCRPGGGGCRRTMCAASATGCAGYATACAPARCRATRRAQRVGAWIAHAAHADTWRLRHAIFTGRLVRCLAVREAWQVPGAWTASRPVSSRRLLEQQSEERSAPRTATGTRPTTATTTRVPPCQHAPRPEPGGSRTLRACEMGVQGRP